MSEQNFWKLIETSWADSPELDKKRMKALETNDENLLYELDEALWMAVMMGFCIADFL
jgi:hypothetical protein